MHISEKLAVIRDQARLGSKVPQCAAAVLETIKKLVHVDDADPSPVAPACSSSVAYEVQDTAAWFATARQATCSIGDHEAQKLSAYFLGQPSTHELYTFTIRGKIAAVKEFQARTGQGLSQSQRAIELAADQLNLTYKGPLQNF